MELVNRYVYAVGRRLPKAQRQDISAELADDIQSQIEEKEQALGRPLDADETAAVLQSYGHPVIVAARYARQQSLIGPALLPFYWNTLKVVLTAVAACGVVVASLKAMLTQDVPAALMAFWGLFWTSSLIAIGIVTIIFALLERSQSHTIGTWNARTLPAIRENKPISRWEIALEIVLTAAVALWILDVPGLRHALLSILVGPARDAYRPQLVIAPALGWFSSIFLFNCTVTLAQNAVNWFRPYWKQLRWASRALTNAIFAIAIFMLLRGRQFILEAGYVPHGAQSAAVAHWFNLSLFYVAVFIGTGCAIAAAFNIYQLARRPQVLTKF